MILKVNSVKPKIRLIVLVEKITFKKKLKALHM